MKQKILIIVSVILFSISLYYIVNYQIDNVYLKTKASSVVGNKTNKEEILEVLVKYIAKEVPIFPVYNIRRNPLYKLTGVPPRDVYKYGGICGHKARLLIVILRFYNIPAHKLYLNKGSHAIVEAYLNGKWIVVDPHYGIVYRDTEGKLVTVGQIMNDSRILMNVVKKGYPLQFFPFTNIRRLRWGKLPWTGERIYSLLSVIFTEERVNRIHYPYFMENPSLVLSLLFLFLTVIALSFTIHKNQKLRKYEARDI